MTLRFLVVAGGLLALALIGAMFRARRGRSDDIGGDQLSGEWIAQVRAREEEQW